jgi:hypothetical protein
VSIAIPELNFVQICAASEWLDPASRRASLFETAAALTGVEIAEGLVARIAAQTFLAHFAPPETDERREGHPLKKVNTQREAT